MSADKTLSASEVSAHSTPETGLYIIIDESVYDVTGFVAEHPGGAKILTRAAGKDASRQFWKVCVVLFLFSLVCWLLRGIGRGAEGPKGKWGRGGLEGLWANANVMVAWGSIIMRAC